MIYLFNSAFRPKYATNILNTLFLPEGSVNEYRYHYAGPGQNVDPSIGTYLTPGCEACIVFANRFGTDRQGRRIFTFYPIRLATIISHEFSNGQLFVRVLLGTFVHPINPSEYQTLITQTIGNNQLPRLNNYDPTQTANGFFVLSGKRTVTKQSVLYGDKAWRNTVDMLSRIAPFAYPDNKVVFLRCDFFTHSFLDRRWRRAKTVHRKETSFLRLVRKQTYEMRLTYQFPAQTADQNETALLRVDPGHGLHLSSQSEQLFDARASRNEFSFATKTYVEDKGGAITLHFDKTPADQGVSIQIDAALRYEISNSRLSLVALAVVILLYALASTTIGIDWPGVAEDLQYQNANGWIEKANAILQHGYTWIKLVAGLIQAIALFAVVRLLGKRIF